MNVLPNPFDPNSDAHVPIASGSAAAAPCPPSTAAAEAIQVSVAEPCGAMEKAVIDSCQEPVAADLLQALGALSGTDLIDEIFAVKPKHFKLKHKLKIPPFAPDYEAIWNAMHDPNAPRALETDPVWADGSPIFLRDA